MEIKELLEELKSFTDGEHLAPHLQEEFLVNKGQLDHNYVSYVTETKISARKLRAEVNKVFGKVSFETREVNNEVSKDLWDTEYQFGKFPNVKGWIGYFYRKYDKLLTKEALYGYVLAS